MLLKTAIRIILHEKVRFLGAVAGVALAMFQVLLQWGFYFGYQRDTSVVLDAFDADLWIVPKGQTTLDGFTTIDDLAYWKARGCRTSRKPRGSCGASRRFAIPSTAPHSASRSWASSSNRASASTWKPAARTRRHWCGPTATFSWGPRASVNWASIASTPTAWRSSAAGPSWSASLKTSIFSRRWASWSQDSTTPRHFWDFLRRR